MEFKDGLEGLATFIALHRAQLQTSAVPEYYWETLYNKLKHGTFDAGQVFGLSQIETEEQEEGDDDTLYKNPFCCWKALVTCPEGIKASDANHIYLVDHAWTFRPNQARNHLNTIPGLLERMCGLVGTSFDVNKKDETVENVMEQVWKYSQSYSIGNSELQAEDRLPIWYIMDEFGSHIQHSDEPSARVVPFFYLPEQATYSLLFPIVDLEESDEVTRDFVEGSASDVVSQAALLAPWSPVFEQKYLPYISLAQQEPSADYFLGSRVNETLPNPDVDLEELPKDRPIRTYAEYSFIRQFLTHPRFQIVENSNEADILWLSTHFKSYKELSEDSPGRRVNQFPFEHLLTVKDLLCIVARRANKGQPIDETSMKTKPSWLPTTFNLKTELAQFVAFYLAQKAKGMNNYWIVKPWNLARSLDTHITDNLDFILRLAVSGPKIAQRYIDRPVLFRRIELNLSVKFDVRYIILLRSVNPLRVYAYRRFWLRFANQPFELNHFDEYERHFTVMNYSPTDLHQMFCHDYIRYFEEQNPGQSWSVVEKRIFKMLKELFDTVVDGEPPSHLAESRQSRAMYAVDLMLQWTDDVLDDEAAGPCIEPQLLEVNWSPDCNRACDYYPEFFNDVFSVLFLDETEDKNVTLL